MLILLLVTENVEEFAQAFSDYWRHKRSLARGSEPEHVTKMFAILSDLCYGQVCVKHYSLFLTWLWIFFFFEFCFEEG